MNLYKIILIIENASNIPSSMDFQFQFNQKERERESLDKEYITQHLCRTLRLKVKEENDSEFSIHSNRSYSHATMDFRSVCAYPNMCHTTHTRDETACKISICVCVCMRVFMARSYFFYIPSYSLVRTYVCGCVAPSIYGIHTCRNICAFCRHRNSNKK